MLTIAVPKGGLFDKTMELFSMIGVKIPPKETIKRKLSFTDEEGKYKFIIVRNMDVPPYVEHGAADLGVVGKDIIEESQGKIVELIDLKFGFCQLCVCAKTTDKLNPKKLWPNIRVSSKFVHCAEEYFRKKDLKAEIIKLYGSIELAPIVGLSDVIIDLVATGRTLKENGMEVIDTIFDTTARLVSNKVSLKADYDEIKELSEKLQWAVGEKCKEKS